MLGRETAKLLNYFDTLNRNLVARKRSSYGFTNTGNSDEEIFQRFADC
jgi:hypothetical protein